MSANELNYVQLGQRIRAARIKKGLQQYEVAELAGLTASHMSHIETGQTKPSLPTVVKIANVLSVSLDELVCDSIDQSMHVHDLRIAEELSDCDSTELQSIFEIIRSVKSALRKKHNH